MQVSAMIGSSPLNPKLIEPDTFIIMRELDSPALKVNHLSLYLKAAICQMYPSAEVDSIDKSIDAIDLLIFVNGICEENNSVRTLLSKNIVYQLTKQGIEIPFSNIYGILNISKSTDTQTI